jgi:hypothetical protein
MPTRPATKMIRRVRVRRMISPCRACSAEKTGASSPCLIAASIAPITAHDRLLPWNLSRTTTALRLKFRMTALQKKRSQRCEEGTLFPANSLVRLRPSQPEASHVQFHKSQRPEQTHLHDGLCFGGSGNAAHGHADKSRRAAFLPKRPSRAICRRFRCGSTSRPTPSRSTIARACLTHCVIMLA